MVLRMIGLKEEESYAEDLTSKSPDWHKRVSKSSAKLNDEPFVLSTGSRMDHKVRAGVIKPTAEIEGYCDLKRIGHSFKAFLDNYVFTSGNKNTHEFYGGECSELTSFSGWATFDYFQKLIKGMVMESLKLEVSNEAMTETEEWIYATETSEEIDEKTYEVRDIEGAIPLMFYDVSVELEGKELPGIATSFSFEGNNNLNVDNTIGLGSRWPQKRAAAQKREIKLSIVSSMTQDTVELIRKSEYGEDRYDPSPCKIFTADLKVLVAMCEDPEETLEILFPKCHFAVEYETSESDETEVTFNLQTLGSGEVTLADGSTVHTDMYAKLVNDQDEISPSD